MIGKNPIVFDFDDIILNGKKHILIPGMWRLLTHTADVTKPEFYTNEDELSKLCKNINCNRFNIPK